MSVATYTAEPMYPKVVRAVASILARGTTVAPVDVLVAMGKLRPADLDAWRRGRVPFLERVVQGNLTQLRRFLRILRFHLHDLNLVPGVERYAHRGHALRFTKNDEPRLERIYATSFRWPGKGAFPMERAMGKLADPGAPSAGTDASGSDYGEAPAS